MSWPFGNLQRFGADVVVADVPARFELRGRASTKSAEGLYDLMSDEEIAAMPVGHLVRQHALLLYWTQGWAVASGRAQNIIRAWGAEPISLIMWLKTTANGKRRRGTGYRVINYSEPIILAKWGNPDHIPFPSDFSGVARRHSEKPVEFDELTIKHTPNAQCRYNLFSGGIERPGFIGWGEDHRAPDFQRRETTNGSRKASARSQQSPLFGETVFDAHHVHRPEADEGQAPVLRDT